MLGSAKLQRMIIKKGHLEEGDVGEATTSAKRVTADARVLREAAQNAVAISVAFTSDDMNRRELAILTRLPEPIKKRQGLCNQLCRNLDGNVEYAIDVCTGGYFGHLEEIAELVTSRSVLTSAFFVADVVAHRNAPLIAEDELADLAGQFAMALIFSRLRRSLDRVYGWPSRLRGALRSPSHEEAIFNDFGQDIAVFKNLRSLPEATTSLHKQFRRRLMHLVVVQQLQHGYEAGAASREDSRALLRRRCKVFSGSILEEEKFKVMKSDKQLKGGRTSASPRSGSPSAWSSGLWTHGTPTPQFRLTAGTFSLGSGWSAPCLRRSSRTPA